MKISSIRLFLAALGFIACMVTTTSCNKGYGCPSDFSVDARTEAPVSVEYSC